MSDIPAEQEQIPREFFCPVTKSFMRDPVFYPRTPFPITCDRSAFRILQISPDEFCVDLEMRDRINAWLSQHTLHPTFAFVSTPQLFTMAAHSLIRQSNQINPHDLLSLLRELHTTVHANENLVDTPQAVECVGELLAICPFQIASQKRKRKEEPLMDKSCAPQLQWVKYCVSILARATAISDATYPDFPWQPLLSQIAPICFEIADTDFHLGLVNLLHCLALSKTRGDGSPPPRLTHVTPFVSTLASYAIWRASEFDSSLFVWWKLFRLMYEILNGGLGFADSDPLFLRGFVCFCEPIKVGRALSTQELQQYWATIAGLSCTESTCHIIVHVGIVHAVVHMLFLARRNNDVLRPDTQTLCMNVLCNVSRTEKGRRNIIRIMVRQPIAMDEEYYGLDEFYLTIYENVEKESLVRPALNMLLNAVQGSRNSALCHQDYQVNITDENNRFAQVYTVKNVLDRLQQTGNPNYHKLLNQLDSLLIEINQNQVNYIGF